MGSQREASPFLCNEPLFLEENIKGELRVDIGGESRVKLKGS